ncbi:hypothetical protein ACQEVC_03605 [Plantactinospora sp. CA-294935]
MTSQNRMQQAEERAGDTGDDVDPEGGAALLTLPLRAGSGVPR